MSTPLDNPKLLPLVAAVARRAQCRTDGKKMVLTNGVFDLLHTGHIYFLQRARTLGDMMIVALNSDSSVRRLKGPLRPVQTEEERAYALAALSCVDAIVIFNELRLTAEIRTLRPDVYVKACDYTVATLDPGERAALEEVGASIEFMPFLSGFSTTQLIAKIKAAGGI
ncbi:MAG TPA: adenylyltransferase/cytidyltransferase family protein [Opitutaceae bacterium]|nr:adenylyltransferase/cytidyltransferase family protein [Opitutaceae bacterium]